MRLSGTVVGFLFVNLLLAGHAFGGVQVIPAVSHDGNVTLEWGAGACDNNTTIRTNITKQVGTQAVAVATLPTGTFEYKLTNLANGSYQYKRVPLLEYDDECLLLTFYTVDFHRQSQCPSCNRPGFFRED